MSYADLIYQENEYTYSVNIQFDIETDVKLSRFIPNETTIRMFREYFTDIVRSKPYNHSRILYGSYGTGKSHFLTVLGQILQKSFVNSDASKMFLTRIREYDPALANDIESYLSATDRKPYLIVPIVFDFDDFNRCIYFSLKKKLESIGTKINYKTFYDQALELLTKWTSNETSNIRLNEIAEKHRINLDKLVSHLSNFDPKAEDDFELLFKEMTYGVKYVYEVSSLSETLDQANSAIDNNYSGIVFIFDEFGRYIEDNIKKIRVKDVQDLAEYCDHCAANDHIILVSHKEISQYTKRYGKSVASEWKKVEGRYKSDSINNKQDQCLSLIRSILIKNDPQWKQFKTKYSSELEKMYSDAMDFKGFLINVSDNSNPFEGGFPIHPIALFALDRLSKKVAQNDRTFFTYLASKEENSLYRFLVAHDTNEFHFVGISEIYDYFEPSIKAVQSDDNYEWYKKLQTALAKNHSDTYSDSPEVKILKVIATIGLINDSAALVANKRTITSTIDCPNQIIENAIEALCLKKIIKYSGTYERYEFFDASIFDVEAIIDEESTFISEENVIRTLNDDFINFVLYPNEYNHAYKISRVFVPVFTSIENVRKKSFLNKIGQYYDGLLIMLIGDAESNQEEISDISISVPRSIVWSNCDCAELIRTVKKYIAVQYIDSQKAKYLEQDPAFEKELIYHKNEIIAKINYLIDEWKHFIASETKIHVNGERINNVTNMDDVAELASDIMFSSYSQTLLVNNELINKNNVSPSIATARRNAIRAILSEKSSETYFDLQYLSPEYIAVRSVLVKNGFIHPSDAGQLNALPSGEQPQVALGKEIKKIINRAKKASVEFNEVYCTLKGSPYGLRDGYLPLVFAYVLSPFKKTLLITTHGAEQEITAELFEEIVKRPDDFCFTLADWTHEQIEFIDSLEQEFLSYIDQSALAKNRLKAIYEAMLSHYRDVPKFSRTTELYVSEPAKNYRKIITKTCDNYSKFFFKTIIGNSKDYMSSVRLIANSKAELDRATDLLMNDIHKYILELVGTDVNTSLATALKHKYLTCWQEKRQRVFDYYANVFLEYVSKIQGEANNEDVISQLAKSLIGIEINYWNDSHIEEFKNRIHEIIQRLEASASSQNTEDKETNVSITNEDGKTKTLYLDNVPLSDLGLTIKEKVASTVRNFGLSVSNEEKVKIYVSLLSDLIEGK